MDQKRRRAARDVSGAPANGYDRAGIPRPKARRTEAPEAPTDLPSREPDELTQDGGVADHPIHDDDLEDHDSGDYEQDVDDVDDEVEGSDKVEPLDVALRKRS